eukprot:UN02909
MHFQTRKTKKEFDFNNWFELELARYDHLQSDIHKMYSLYSNSNQYNNNIEQHYGFNEFEALWSRVLTNAYFTEDNDTAKIILWFASSLTNHSCFPNVHSMPSNPKIHRAAVDIKKVVKYFVVIDHLIQRVFLV